MPLCRLPAPGGRGYRRYLRPAGLVVTFALAPSACGAPPPPPPGPPIDAARIALVLEAATRLDEPARIVFSWALDDRDLRLRGRGVARVEPPYRARLDLFLANGEGLVAAALVDGELRLPRGAREGVLPPPDLLWAALGVFKPGADAARLGADAPEEGSVRLRYGYPDGTRVHYTVAGNRILAVELLRDGRVVERATVDAAGDGERFPEEAVYRDLAAFRELRITRESVEHVEPYPPDVWIVP